MRVAVLLNSSVAYDRRALLEIETLETLPVQLTVFCNTEEGKPETEIIGKTKFIRIFTTEIYETKKWRKKKEFAAKIGAHNFDIFHCHDSSMLWLGKILKSRNSEAVLIYESRELFHHYPLNYSSHKLSIKIKSWLALKAEIWMEKRNARAMDYLITVNDSLAEVLTRYFRSHNPVTVTRNMGRLESISERNHVLRRKFNIPDTDKIVVYIGIHIYRNSLQMEKVIEQLGNRTGISIVVIARDNFHLQWFKEFAKEKKIKNIFFHPPIPIKEITAYLSGCDVGILTAWNKKDLSYWLALDNKLFSYIQAEIPILTTQQPEYRKIVEGYNVGVCINPDEPDAFLIGFNEIIEKYNSFLPHLKKAKEELCWEKEEQRLIGLYQNIMQKNN